MSITSLSYEKINYEDNIKQNWQEHNFCDVTFSCEGNYIEAHKIIVASCSEVLQNMLRQNSHEKPLIYLRGVKYSNMVNVLNLMYQGQVNIDQKELKAFFNLCKDLKINGIARMGTNKVEQNDEFFVDDNMSGFQSDLDEVFKQLNKEEVFEKKEGDYNIIQKDVSGDNEGNKNDSKSEDTDKFEFKQEIDEENLQFICDQCNYTSKSKYRLKYHIRSKHEGISFSCDKCEKIFEQKTNFQSHYKRQHLDTKQQCNSCEYSCDKKDQLKMHVNSAHKGMLVFKCDRCDHQYNRKYRLANHILKMHPTETKFSCSKCGFKAISEDHLRKHLYIPHGHFCQQCEYKATSTNKLKYHILEVHAC